jgi:uncharacterized protein (DUF1697 family)
MAELKICFERLGLAKVQTYINSGNVIFQSDILDAWALEGQIEKAITAQFSFKVAAIVRNLEEMRRIIADIPKNWQTSIDQKCNVIFAACRGQPQNSGEF